MNRLYYILILLVFATVTTRAQYNLGVATGNWSGTQSLYLNPAAIADNNERFVIDIFSITGGLENSLGTISKSGGLLDVINKGSTDNLFSYSGNNQFSLLAPYVQAHLPGVMVSIGKKLSLALTTGVRGMNQFNNFDRSLYRTLTDPTYLPDGNLVLTSNKFNYTAHVWSEVGLSCGAVLFQNAQHELKAGITLKYLGGIGYLGLKGNNLDAQYKTNNDSLFVSHSDIEFASNIISTKSAILNGVSNHNIFSEFFGSKDGRGMGADFGLIYEFTPKQKKEEKPVAKGDKVKEKKNTEKNYLFRISAAITDIGSIKYGKDNNSNATVTGNGIISGKDFSANVTNFEDFRTYAKSHGFTADTSHQDTKVYMPTTLHLAADYHAWKRFYVNATFIANLANRQNFGNSYYNQVTVTPRYDCRLFSIGLPVTYGTMSKSMKVGLGARISGFFIGSDDMLAMFAGNQSGFNIYAGGYIPFHRHNKKEKAGKGEDEPEPDSEHGGSSDSSDVSFVPAYKEVNTGVVTALSETGNVVEHNPIHHRRAVHEEMDVEKH